MTKESNSIKLRVAETCHSDTLAIDSCNYCKKQGMPILIARYAVRGTESPALNFTMKANSRVANAMPWDLSPDRTLNVKRSHDNQDQENIESATLASFAEYILRRPRQGYLYIYDEIYGGQWKGYYIDAKGYIKSEILSKPTSLSSEESFSCNSNPENVAFGSIITLPHPEINRKIYLAYVEATWSSEWRRKISKDENWRKIHMQSFTMNSSYSNADIYPIEQLEELILEYSNDALMAQLDNNNSLFSEILSEIKSKQSIAKYTKKTIINHAKKHHYPTPFILALHDNIGITLHLNELRVAQQIMLQDKMQNPEIKRRHLCVSALMSIEASIRNSPYATVKYDGIPRSESLGKKAWKLVSSDELTEKNTITSDFHVDGVFDGKTYEQCQQEDAKDMARYTKVSTGEEMIPHEEIMLHEDTSPSGEKFLLAMKSKAKELQNIWDAQADAQEQIAKEFYLSKYFDYNKYYYDKINFLNENKRIKEITERLDFDYCWWLKNKLSIALEVYDKNDVHHRSVATSLLSRALTGGIIAQSSHDLWKQFHDSPEENSQKIIIKGILGWHDELAKNLQGFLATDTAGPISNKKKPKTIFEEYYIKEIGKIIKKLNSLYKDRDKIIDKDFSKKALNAFHKMHESAQEIADTVESTHKALIASEQHIAIKGLTEDIRSRANKKSIKYSQYELHSSGLRVTQFKMLRIMHAHRMACMDIVAHVKSLEKINNKILSQSALLEKLENNYAHFSRQAFSINNIERHIIFLERPIVDFFDDIARLNAQKTSDQIKNVKNDLIVLKNKTVNSNGVETDEKNIKYNNPDTHLYNRGLIEQVFMYSDSDAPIIENSIDNLSALEEFSSSDSEKERLDNEIARKKYNTILREEYTKSMNKDFRNRWVGRLSRLSIYWGFMESFEKLVKNPTDLQAWWKMSGSIVFVTQSYFDAWEQAAKQRLAYLDAAQEAEIAVQGSAPEYLITGSKAAGAEMQFAKLWSKRIGVIGSIIGIIDGLRELAHAQEMRQHGELRSDVLIAEAKGWISIAGGITGIILIETVLTGGVFAIFAFAIALWLLPSTETLLPLGVRNWLRRSLFKLSCDDSRYRPFSNWEEEQSSFKTILKGIEIDTKLDYNSNININPDPPFYIITTTMKAPLAIAENIIYSLEYSENGKYIPVFLYSMQKINENITIKNSFIELPKRFSIYNQTDHQNPSLKTENGITIITSYIYVDRKKKVFKQGMLNEHKKHDQLKLTVKTSDLETIDSYVFFLEW